MPQEALLALVTARCSSRAVLLMKGWSVNDLLRDPAVITQLERQREAPTHLAFSGGKREAGEEKHTSLSSSLRFTSVEEVRPVSGRLTRRLLEGDCCSISLDGIYVPQCFGLVRVSVFHHSHVKAMSLQEISSCQRRLY